MIIIIIIIIIIIVIIKIIIIIKVYFKITSNEAQQNVLVLIIPKKRVYSEG